MSILVGSVVRLKCGGPRMVVVRVTSCQAQCNYIHDGELKEIHVPSDVLAQDYMFASPVLGGDVNYVNESLRKLAPR